MPTEHVYITDKIYKTLMKRTKPGQSVSKLIAELVAEVGKDPKEDG